MPFLLQTLIFDECNHPWPGGSEDILQPYGKYPAIYGYLPVHPNLATRGFAMGTLNTVFWPAQVGWRAPVDGEGPFAAIWHEKYSSDMQFAFAFDGTWGEEAWIGLLIRYNPDDNTGYLLTLERDEGDTVATLYKNDVPNGYLFDPEKVVTSHRADGQLGIEADYWACQLIGGDFEIYGGIDTNGNHPTETPVLVLTDPSPLGQEGHFGGFFKEAQPETSKGAVTWDMHAGSISALNPVAAINITSTSAQPRATTSAAFTLLEVILVSQSQLPGTPEDFSGYDGPYHESVTPESPATEVSPGTFTFDAATGLTPFSGYRFAFHLVEVGGAHHYSYADFTTLRAITNIQATNIAQDTASTEMDVAVAGTVHCVVANRAPTAWEMEQLMADGLL